MTGFTSDLILARLQTLHPKSIDLSLGRIERLLERLDHPERHLPPVVHIAGTNGKGSTLAMLAAMLERLGRRVDRYISPHLVRFNERILCDGKPIDETRLALVLDQCERANGGAPITFFEITTAAAFVAFAARPADWLLLETGLGGRLDATNVVARPRLTLISPISMDHESYLGSTMREIATEKAGILKPGVPVIVGPQQAPALDVLTARAAELGCPLLAHGRDWSVRAATDGLVLESPGRTLHLPRPALRGVHQIDNAGLAVMAALALEEAAAQPADLAHGLLTATWPARLQLLTRGPLIEHVQLRDGTVWLDGGHNPAAGEMLARSLADRVGRRPLHLVVGMLSTKDLAAFLAPLVPLARSIRTVPVPGEAASQDPHVAAGIARRLGATATAAHDVGAALTAIAAAATAPFDVLICGSLYLAGDVLRAHG